jgi:hypothetical protein
MLPDPLGLLRLLRPAWASSAARVPEALLRRAVASLPEGVDENLAALVRKLGAERLDALMRSPLRTPVLELIFWQLPQQLDRRIAGSPIAAIRWRITGRPGDQTTDVFDLLIEDGTARCLRGGGHPTPRLTITLDGAELVRIAIGSSDPLSAYLAGKLSVRGDLMQAARLTTLFRIPSRPRGN